MTITNERPHRRHGHGYGVAFWKGNSASNEEEADRAVVYAGAPGMPYPEFNFALPAQRHGMEQLELALQKVFEAGVHSGKAEVRQALGIRG